MNINLKTQQDRLVKAIENEVDWFIARIQEQDPHKRELYHAVWLRKRDELRKIVEEVYENTRRLS